MRIARRRSHHWSLAITVLLVLATGAAIVKVEASPNGDKPPATPTGETVLRPRGNTTLAAVRRFRDFPVNYAGRVAAGYRLYGIMREDHTSPAPHTEFVFMYGTCRAPHDSSCPPPLEIISWPACYRYETRYAIKRNERLTLRGVPGRVLRSFPRIELYPAETTIIMHGALRRPALRRVALSVRGVNVIKPPGSRLPPRPPRVDTGTVKCRAP